jgi:hypothetical protein
MQKQINGGRMVFSTNDIGTIGCPQAKKKLISFQISQRTFEN